MTTRGGLAGRLWTYQAERFPLFRHGVLIAAFAGAAVAYARLLRETPGWSQATAAAAVVFLLFFQLRVADEHKDYADDLRFRPERPVTRGLISLSELRALGLAAALIQVTVAAAVDARLVGWLALAWGWMGLMSAEFFAPRLLKARPVLYLLSHMLVMPLIALFALACGGDGGPPLHAGSAAFLALAFFSGAAVEISRKAWAPGDEREGVQTYSRLWGPSGAAAGIALAMVASGAAAMLAQAGAAVPPALHAGPALATAAGTGAAVAYARRPTPTASRTLDMVVGLAALGLYASVSLLPTAVAAWTP